jgi:hypothetical protein
MEPLVDNSVMSELTQILSNLVLGENEIRREYVQITSIPI